MSEAKIITLADGIDAVAARYVERFEPHQRMLDAGWRDMQRIVSALGTPTLREGGRYYTAPKVELQVTAFDHEDKPVDTSAIVAVRAVLKRARSDRVTRAVSLLHECEVNEVPMLRSAHADLWGDIHEATNSYTVTVMPTNPNLRGDKEYLRRPVAPTHLEWTRVIDEDGPTDAWKLNTILAEERLETLCDTMSLFERGSGAPGPTTGEGLPSAQSYLYGTEAGIFL